MRRFEYHEPRTLEDAVALLGRYNGAASVLAGGTDLLVEIKEQLRRPDHVVNIKKIPGIDAFSFDERSGLRIGALVTARTLETSPLVLDQYPGLAQAARELGSIQIRNRATLVGNVCRASPSADTLPPLIADRAVTRIYGPRGARTVPLEQFFTGPGRTVLAADELLTEIIIPAPAPHTGKVYIKHGRRKAMELATVGVAVALTMQRDMCKDISIVLGAVAPTPIRAASAEAALRGAKLDDERMRDAARAARAQARPISNVRASAEYRAEMVEVLTRRALEQARELAR
jgi:aerobic carbon-monoxide dehydrogenase medium subunit